MSHLKKLKVVIADEDTVLAGVLRKAFLTLGIGKVEIASTAAETLRLFQSGQADFIVTEWQMPDMSGAQLLQHARRHPGTCIPNLPIMVYTAQTQREHVEAARDAGTNEFIAKPFTVFSILEPLERIIDSPKDFIVSKNFIGPERRTKKNTLVNTDRRKHKPTVANSTHTPTNTALSPNHPIMWKADFSLKRAIGTNLPFAELVPPEVIQEAQRSVEASKAEGHKWLENDFEQILQAFSQLRSSAATAVAMLCKFALSLKARAGTFGEAPTSEVAWSLYQFCNSHYANDNDEHYVVLEKHIQALQNFLILPQGQKQERLQRELVTELGRLVARYAV